MVVRSDVGPKRRVLVFHIGSLGDTLVALPAMWAVRDHFGDSHMCLLTKTSARPGIPVGEDILQGSGLFDDFILFNGDYHAYGRNLTSTEKAWGALKLWWRLRQGRYDTAIYLAPSLRDQAQIDRDIRFFKAAGIPRVIGAKELLAPSAAPTPSQRSPFEAQWMLHRLTGSEVPAPELERARIDLALQPTELTQAQAWLRQRGADLNRTCVAFAPGTNLQSKRWPQERFEEVGRRLIERFDIWPIVLGGPEDVEAGQELINAWGRGTQAAHQLSVRQSAAVVSHCALYIGNDTGVMHLAASEKVPCVAVFSARDLPGKWEPLGTGHTVLRSDVPCAGCMLVRCEEEQRRCLMQISADEVLGHAARVLVCAAPRTSPHIQLRAGR